MANRPSRREVTHDRIVETASRHVRRNGFAGVGVADLMRQAGLTHGGFYAHFESRESMLSEALERAGRDSEVAMAERIAAQQARGASAFRALIDLYLSDAHLSGTEHGCVVAALASEMPRQLGDLAKASAARVRALTALIQRCLPTGAPKDHAMVVAGTLVGSLQLARALGPNAQGKAMLAAARKTLVAQFDSH